MALYLTGIALLIFACVACSKITGKLGIPMLLAFIVLGMALGSDGFFKIQFDNYNLAEKICSFALIFIMFYGGFGTKLSEAKPVALRAVLLSSLGTVITAALVGVFCHTVLKIELLESFLIGAVISSTDAASVFSILRSKRLNLKYNTASLLEIESGSNDPFSYMLTAIILSVMQGTSSGTGVLAMLLKQIVFGALCGVLLAFVSLWLLKRLKTLPSGFDAIFITGAAILSYALPTVLGGNGYLSVYITGIILGNRRIANKKALVNFFDAATLLMQMLLFFVLGLLAFPSQLPHVAPEAICISLFLTFIARPAAVFMLLAPFKSSIRQMLLVSWAGLRGAASIVFAIMTVIHPSVLDNDIFHVVFFIVLFSILLQGTLLPKIAKGLKLTDGDEDVMKTFNDYIDEVPVRFIGFYVPKGHPWAGKRLKEILLPPESLLVLVVRNGEKYTPSGETVIMAGDKLVLSGRSTDKMGEIELFEKELLRGDSMIGKKISELSGEAKLITMIRRGNDVIIPKGSTTLEKGDILVINSD